MLWCYLAPLVAGSVRFVAGLGTAMWATATTVVAIGVVAAVVLRANRSFVREDLRPRRRRIASQIRELEAG